MRTIMMAALLCGWAIPGMAQSAAARPSLTADQALQLFAEAGFPVVDGRPLNRCGKPSNPRVAFVDLNNDQQAEAHIADVDPACYGKPGAYFAILAQQSDKSWKRLIAEDGIIGFEPSRSAGWNDLSLEARDSACPGARRFNGTDYGAPTACATVAVAVAETSAPAAVPIPANNATGPLSQQRLFEWTGDRTPEARALSVADREKLFRAAGMQAIGGGKWTGCPDDVSGRSEAEIVLFRDLNDDGRPEAVIGDGGTFCNGYAGIASTVLTQDAADGWRVVYSNQGFVNFLVSRGVHDFPDIEAGLPSSCSPYFRWDGREYGKIAQLDEDGRACEPF